MDNEVWKDVYGYEGYKASNKGRIKSFLSEKDGKVLSQRYDKDGYKMVWTKYRSGARVHQMVLLAFNPNGYKKGSVVNHKNGIKDDNRIENLEWCTISENTKHGYDIGNSFSANSEPIALKYNGEIISIFNSMNTLAKYCNVSRNCIENECKKGFIFDELKVEKLPKKRYDEDSLFQKPFINTPMSKYNLSPCKHNGRYYESIKKMSELTGFSRSKISWAIKNEKEVDGSKIELVTKYEYIKQ